MNGNGDPLTIKLAVSDVKPRRAKFTVKHGTSAGLEDSEKALLRTANIQTINPAKLYPEEVSLWSDDFMGDMSVASRLPSAESSEFEEPVNPKYARSPSPEEVSLWSDDFMGDM